RAPEDAGALFGTGMVCERDWLALPTPGAADSAVDLFARAGRARPGFAEAWTALAVLRFERGHPDSAFDAATRALAASPDQVQPQLASAYLASRIGMTALADSLFNVAIPHLPAGIAARFDDITPLLASSEAGGFAALPPGQRIEFARRYWALHDPD